MFVRVSTPKLTTCCNQTLNTTSGNTSVTVYSADSLGSTHYRISSLTTTLHSTDPTVMKVIDTARRHIDPVTRERRDLFPRISLGAIDQ